VIDTPAFRLKAFRHDWINALCAHGASPLTDLLVAEARHWVMLGAHVGYFPPPSGQSPHEQMPSGNWFGTPGPGDYGPADFARQLLAAQEDLTLARQTYLELVLFVDDKTFGHRLDEVQEVARTVADLRSADAEKRFDRVEWLLSGSESILDGSSHCWPALWRSAESPVLHEQSPDRLASIEQAQEGLLAALHAEHPELLSAYPGEFGRMGRPKRIVVACDGTWSRHDCAKGASTNVRKLARAIRSEDPNGIPQPSYYHAPIGKFRLSRDVRACYRFLVETYQPGDHLYFFGFSRGAYTARSTAGMVRNCGILRREHADRIHEAYRLYRDRSEEMAPDGSRAREFRQRYAHPEAPIEFVGVWETVGELGIPTSPLRPGWLVRRWAFHDTTLSRHVRHAYHALAIDERRRAFVPTLWVKQVKDGKVVEPPPEQTVSQVWFCGVHSDVGGGYDDPELSEIPLLWIAGRARDCGLVLKPDRLVRGREPIDAAKRRDGSELAPNPNGLLHNSLTLFYRAMRPLDRRFAAIDGEPINSTVASSVPARKVVPAYDPPGFADWVASGVKPTEAEWQQTVPH